MRSDNKIKTLRHQKQEKKSSILFYFLGSLIGLFIYFIFHLIVY